MVPDEKISSITPLDVKKLYSTVYGFSERDEKGRILFPGIADMETVSAFTDALNQLIMEPMAKEKELDGTKFWEWPDDLIFSSEEVLQSFSKAKGLSARFFLNTFGTVRGC